MREKRDNLSPRQESTIIYKNLQDSARINKNLQESARGCRNNLREAENYLQGRLYIEILPLRNTNQ